ncbi:ChaN family lipoprotein [Piscinibacter sakaiensis]|uniref:Putative lipoprotein n=1 Tax=Piscinibacter sakaiensis TaxID=1547922 RepID=A0A0K8NWZ7_PISS1|nr:ChaN family lipoprotein [Piscinibacter sakaiensis]GAP34460.1 putative lipoprotein [Piscinibacter sakaiensis]
MPAALPPPPRHRGPSDPSDPSDPSPPRAAGPRRRLLRAGLAAAVLSAGAGPLRAAVRRGGGPDDGDAPFRLQAAPLVLLGEVHDNAALHRRRAEAVQRALEAGWRPAVAMEVFDRERQADIERARRERPGDADHLIAQAGGRGWDWPLLRPLIALVLAQGLPLLGANLSAGAARRVAREGAAAVFDADERAALGLDRAPPPGWQAAQQAEIEHGHCGLLPAAALPGMVRAQAARDAVMAQVLLQALARPPAGAAPGAVLLLAGNGHVRRDLGVPVWLPPSVRAWSVGYVEAPGNWPAEAFDARVEGTPAERADPCEGLRQPAPAR